MDIIIHSEQCETATIRTKCKQCSADYYREKVQLSRLRKAEKVKNTRSVTNETGSKYKNELCITCKDKLVTKELCSDCKSKYDSAKAREYRKRKKVSKGKINSLDSNSALNSMCQVKKKCEIQTNNILKTKCKVTKLLNNVPDLTNQVQPSNVLKSVCQVESEKYNLHCAQSNHITYPFISERPITTHKIQSENGKKDSESIKLSDLNKVKTPIKKLSKKTLRNKASKINKLLGKSPNRRIQQLTHMVNNSPNEERKAVCKNIIPDLEEQFSGIVYKKK